MKVRMDYVKELEVLRTSVRQLLQVYGTIFVFGSNQAGVHGAGAALEAVSHFRAEPGTGEGPTGQAYAIPTKDEKLQVRPLDKVNESVAQFLDYARDNQEDIFFVTRIGCGFAGYTDAEIAPMFADASENCLLPEGWRQ